MAVLLKGEGFRIQWHPRGIHTHQPGPPRSAVVLKHQLEAIPEVVARASWRIHLGSSWFTLLWKCSRCTPHAWCLSPLNGGEYTYNYNVIACNLYTYFANRSNLQNSAARGCGGECPYNWVSASDNDRCRCPEAMPEKLHLSGHHLKSRLSCPPSSRSNTCKAVQKKKQSRSVPKILKLKIRKIPRLIKSQAILLHQLTDFRHPCGWCMVDCLDINGVSIVTWGSGCKSVVAGWSSFAITLQEKKSVVVPTKLAVKCTREPW